MSEKGARSTGRLRASKTWPLSQTTTTGRTEAARACCCPLACRLRPRLTSPIVRRASIRPRQLHRAQLLGGQRLPTGDSASTRPRLHIVGDAREQPAQLDRGRHLATLNDGGMDRVSLGLGDDKHPERVGMGSRHRTDAGFTLSGTDQEHPCTEPFIERREIVSDGCRCGWQRRGANKPAPSHEPRPVTRIEPQGFGGRRTPERRRAGWTSVANAARSAVA